MELLILSLLNGLSYGLLLFLLGAGLTLILGMMGVLNFAHAAFYMLGAYLAVALTDWLGFWPALLLAPLAVGLLGAAVERGCLRRVQRLGHAAELLLTFGIASVIVELVQLVWGRAPLAFEAPPLLQGPAFTLLRHPSGELQWHAGAAPEALCRAAEAALAAACSGFPATRAFMMGTALLVLLLLWLLLRRTRIGLVVQAALTHPDMVEALGHDLPRIRTGVFAVGTALAALAGVIGGMSFVVEPSMAASLGSLLFVVVVVGGLGSLGGAFVASLAIGLLQTFAVALDAPLSGLAAHWGWQPTAGSPAQALLQLSLAQLAPVLPYLLLVAVLALRPRGLLGTREG